MPQIVRAVFEAVKGGLHLPLVYNTSSYDSLKTLRELDGIIDIYLADLRYASNDYGRKYSHARGYVDAARAAIKEMFRQVGNLQVDSEDIAQKGLIVRHLILPGGIAGSEESLTVAGKGSFAGGDGEHHVPILSGTQSDRAQIPGAGAQNNVRGIQRSHGLAGKIGHGKRLDAGDGIGGNLPAGLFRGRAVR